MARKKESTPAGKMSGAQIMDFLKKKHGAEVAFSLKNENPTEVKDWIPTGSTWLDCIIAKGRSAGIPVGKITGIAGLSGTGKSFLAAIIAQNAQKKGYTVIYFDTENAIDPAFIEASGMDMENFVYIPTKTIEFVFETIESILEQSSDPVVFILDSLANVGSKASQEAGYNPTSSVAEIPRIVSVGLKKLTIPLGEKNGTLIVLNQLRTNIASNTDFDSKALIATGDIYFEPGGKANFYAQSLNLRLTARKGKSAQFKDENGYIIGSEVKVKIYKSRFGSLHRECAFNIIWGDDKVYIQDEESWLDAIIDSEHVKASGAWLEIDGFPKFQRGSWMKRMEDPNFKQRVKEIFEEEVIRNFDDKVGSADRFTDIDRNISEQLLEDLKEISDE